MSFFVGLGFAELQILKKWKWSYLLNWVEYCDEILQTHWYWHDVDHEIVKWHLDWSRFGRGSNSENSEIQLLNRLEYFDKILQKQWYWQDLSQGIAKWHLSSVEALPSAKFWKSENGPIS